MYIFVFGAEDIVDALRGSKQYGMSRISLCDPSRNLEKAFEVYEAFQPDLVIIDERQEKQTDLAYAIRELERDAGIGTAVIQYVHDDRFKDAMRQRGAPHKQRISA